MKEVCADTKIDVLRPLLSLKIIYCARALINTSAINPCQFWEPLQVNSCKKVMPKVEWWTRECADLGWLNNLGFAFQEK